MAESRGPTRPAGAIFRGEVGLTPTATRNSGHQNRKLRSSSRCDAESLSSKWQQWVRHCSDVCCTTALALKAEFHPRSYHVAQVPLADICSAAKPHCYSITSSALAQHWSDSEFDTQDMGKLADNPTAK